MTKAELTDRIVETIHCTRKEAAEYLESVISIMKSTLETGEKIKIAGFGNFEVKQKKDRRGRNPQTGETIILSARKVLTFKPSMVLKQSLNK